MIKTILAVTLARTRYTASLSGGSPGGRRGHPPLGTYSAYSSGSDSPAAVLLGEPVRLPAGLRLLRGRERLEASLPASRSLCG